jgi:hypothetical protein
MPRIFNLHGEVGWDRSEDRSGWASKDAWVGRHIGGELIGGSMYEVEPGNRLWPYHNCAQDRNPPSGGFRSRGTANPFMGCPEPASCGV